MKVHLDVLHPWAYSVERCIIVTSINGFNSIEFEEPNAFSPYIPIEGYFWLNTLIFAYILRYQHHPIDDCTFDINGDSILFSIFDVLIQSIFGVIYFDLCAFDEKQVEKRIVDK